MSGPTVKEDYDYCRSRYHSIVDAVEKVPALAADPDVQLALSAIRNAERAIAARAAELSDD